MMLVSMVQSSSEKQQETRCTRVKLLAGGRLITENQICPSPKSFAVFVKNRLLPRHIEIKVMPRKENDSSNTFTL